MLFSSSHLHMYLKRNAGNEYIVKIVVSNKLGNITSIQNLFIFNKKNKYFANNI